MPEEHATMHLTTEPSQMTAPTTLVIRTDTKGLITQVNEAVLKGCGYSADEVIGQHISRLYQPRLSASGLEQMRARLRQGLPWSGYIKNLCKDGQHFWTKAQIVPTRKDGTIIGYLSVCTGPIAEPQASVPLDLANGTHPTWQRLLSVKTGVVFGVCLVILMLLGTGWLGITGLHRSNEATSAIFHDALEPIRTIGRINFLMADNRAQVALAMHHNPVFHHPGEFNHGVQAHIDAIEKNRVEINALRDGYRAGLTDSQDQKLADAYFAARGRYVDEGLKPAMQALGEGDFYEAEQLLLKKVHPLYLEANQLVEELLKHLTAKADADFQRLQADNVRSERLFYLGIGLGILVISIFGAFFFYATVLPLQSSIRALERITEGNLSAANAAATGFGEPGRVMSAVAVMQVNLRVIIEEIRQRASAIRQQCQRLNHSMMNIAEHSDEQQDRLHLALESIQNNSTEFTGLTEGSDALALMAEQSEQRIQSLLNECLPEGETLGKAPEEQRATLDAILQSNHDLTYKAQELASTVVLQAFSAEDNASQLAQVASLIVDNRAELQDAWVVSQHLEQAAAELDALVQSFE